MRLFLTLIVGLTCVMASSVFAQNEDETKGQDQKSQASVAQTSSTNNPRLKKLLERFPQADANEDGVLTLEEAVSFGRKSGVIPGNSANKALPKQNPADIQASTFGKWKVSKDVQYDTKHERNVLDFYQADSETPTPVVVYFHGGGFRGGDKEHVTRGGGKLLKKFLEAGVSVASCNYPFLKDADYLTIMQHCGRSIQFIRSKRKEWNIDPKNFGAYGVSAGALISEWVAYSPDIAKHDSKDPVDRLSKSLVVAGLSTHKLLGKTEAKATGPTKQFTKNLRRNRYLLLDSRVIESKENVHLTVGVAHKDKNNPLFKEDKPWEPRFDNPYCSVIYDEEEKIYKCWYSIFIKSVREALAPDKRAWANWSEGNRGFGVCYATSKDGIHWEKPELGIIDFNGSKKNNIVIEYTHGVAVMKDLHETDPQKRYKAIHPERANSVVWFSPDGIRWGKKHNAGAISHGDTNQAVWWDEDLGKYVLITRRWGGATTEGRYGGGGHRQKVRSVSSDFLKWSKPELVIEGLDLRMQIHDMPVVPHAGVYLGMVGLFDIEASKQWCELAWSPDSIEWHRIQPGKPLIPNGPVMGDYDWGCIFTSKPIVRKDEILLYYGANDGRFMAWRSGYFALARLRPDGFAGYEQIAGGSNKTGSLTTNAVLVVGNSLCVSADVAPSGFVKVTVLDEDNNKLAEGELIPKTVTDAQIQWKDGFSFKKLKGKEIKLGFELRESKLYSFSFMGKAAMKKASTKKLKRVDLTKIPSPQVLPGNENNHYRDPTAIYHDGVFRLFFTVNQPRDNKKYMVSFLGTTTSRDLVNWTPVKLLTPEDPALNYSSPGNIIRYNGEWTMCFQTYPIPILEGFGGDGTARLFIMRSKDLENWSEPELLKVKGPDVPRERMGRMIDPYLIEDKNEPGKWWCFYKQDGVSMSYSYDFKTWKYFSRTEAGENSCVLLRNDRYHLIHSPGEDGMGLMSSKDLKNWEPVVKGTIKLGYKVWPWAMARLTAGFALDLKEDPRVGKYLMFYHGTESENPHEHIGICSLGIAWSDDLINWSWPKKPEE